MDTENKIIHIDPLLDYTANLPSVFATARHTLTMRELKAFLFFLSVTQANTPEDELNHYHEYTFYAGELAERLQEDRKKRRPSDVVKTFHSLQDKTIYFTDEQYEGEDQDNINSDRYKLFNTVKYRGRVKNKPLKLSISAELNQFLYESKSKIPFSFDELNRISSLKAMQVFMYLKTLDADGTNSVPIIQFMIDLDLNTPSYSDFKELNRRILKPAEKEIRKSTPYKDFSITHDGRRGQSPRCLYWQFVTPAVIADTGHNRLTLSSLEPDVADKVRHLSEEKQKAIMRAVQAGFSPTYINSLIAYNQPDTIFCANIDLAIMRSESKRLSPEETGRMILKAVSRSWVEMESNKEYLEQKEVAHRARVTQCELELGITQEVEMEATYKRRAAEYFTRMTTEEKKAFFTQKNSFILNIFGHTKEFNFNNYLHRKENGKPDWRYREVKAARDVVMNMMKNGDIKL